MVAARGCRWLLAIALATPAAHAQVFDGWNITGSNTLRLERYDAEGNAAFGPFQHLGTTAFDELVLAGTRRPSPWSMQRFFVSGVLNDSPYRSAYEGFVPERLNFTAESGESALAWRLEAGDFFSFTSLRTLQRSLKGASLELQPPGPPGLRQSLLFFGGATQPSWRDDRWSDNAFGASWLAETDRFGRWNASVVHQRRAADAFVPTSRAQWVASIAGEALLLDAGGWKVRAEAELAGFDGDHDTGSARDVRDSAVFAQLSGFDPTFDWRLRGERYGADYRPFGAVTPADRRSLEAHAGWNLAGGLALRARVQDYRDQWESDNPLDTRVIGGSLSGGYAPFAISGSLDAFVQESERADRSQDSRFTQASLNLSRSFGTWVAQVGASRLDDENRLDASRSFTTTQAHLSASVPLRIDTLTGMVMPGALYRRTTGSGATRDWQPTLAVTLQGGR